jgi:hypothetical protein
MGMFEKRISARSVCLSYLDDFSEKARIVGRSAGDKRETLLAVGNRGKIRQLGKELDTVVGLGLFGVFAKLGASRACRAYVRK